MLAKEKLIAETRQETKFDGVLPPELWDDYRRLKEAYYDGFLDPFLDYFCFSVGIWFVCARFHSKAIQQRGTAV